MSIESAKAFYQRVSTDLNFRAQIESYSIEERIKFLRESGYSFTEEEWKVATDENLDTTFTDGEINEAELDAVAGGQTLSVWTGKTVGDWLEENYPGVKFIF